MKKILAALRAAALEGRREIEGGDWARYELSDAAFTRIVPRRREDAISEAMVCSGAWWRGDGGFTYRGL